MAASEWYAERSPLAALGFGHEVDLMIRRILAAPLAYAPYLRKTRRAPFPRFPFAVIYRVDGDFIEVIAIEHQKRRPGYWRQRRADR